MLCERSDLPCSARIGSESGGPDLTAGVACSATLCSGLANSRRHAGKIIFVHANSSFATNCLPQAHSNLIATADARLSRAIGKGLMDKSGRAVVNYHGSPQWTATEMSHSLFVNGIAPLRTRT